MAENKSGNRMGDNGKGRSTKTHHILTGALTPRDCDCGSKPGLIFKDARKRPWLVFRITCACDLCGPWRHNIKQAAKAF
jgi:hypothetical protein